MHSRTYQKQLYVAFRAVSLVLRGACNLSLKTLVKVAQMNEPNGFIANVQKFHILCVLTVNE